MQAIKAVQVFCEAKKDRLVSKTYNYRTIQQKEDHMIEIPKHAINIHTKRRKENHCDYLHLLNVGAKIENQKEPKNKKDLSSLKTHNSH